MIRHRIGRDRNGDAVLTITVTGYSDMYRFSRNMLDDQCEFADVARKVFQYMARKMGLARFRALDARMTGGLDTDGKLEKSGDVVKAAAHVRPRRDW